MSKHRLIRLLDVVSGDATHVKIELSYNIGGMNYFQSVSEKRGLWLSVTPVTRTTYEGRIVGESVRGFSGTKTMVKELSKFSQKALDTFVIDEALVKRLVDHIVSKNRLVLKD